MIKNQVKLTGMGKFAGLIVVVAAALSSGCATGDPRLQGTWKSHKVPMPVVMVKETKMETVRVRKGSRRTKQVPRTVMVAREQSAPPYLPLTLRFEGSSVTFELPAESGDRPWRKKVPYKVAATDEKSIAIALNRPGSSSTDYIQMVFDGPDRYWVNPAGGQGWKEYYDRVAR